MGGESAIVVGYSRRLGGLTDVERGLGALPDVELVELSLGTEREIADNAANADVLIVGAVEPFTRAALEHLDRLSLLVRRGVGVDNVDLAAAADLGIPVAHVPDATVEEVSDQALALLLAAERRVVASDRRLREGGGAAAREPVAQARRFRDMTLGVVGLGRIGSALAEKAASVYGRLVGYDVMPGGGQIERCSLERLLEQADAVSVHLPLTDETARMFDAEAFGRMKAGAVFVNTSRGEVVDEAALLDALASGTVGAAGLDVTEEDPPTPSNPLLSFEQVIVTGHSGARGVTGSLELRRRSVAAVAAAIAGDPPQNIAPPTTWPPRRPGSRMRPGE